MILTNRYWRERSYWRSWIIAIGASLAVTLLLTLPFLPSIYGFMRVQAISGLHETHASR